MKARELAELSATVAVNKMMNRLKRESMVKDYEMNSFSKTEELLKLYPLLSDDHPEKIRIDEALNKIKKDEYASIINMYYFDCLSHYTISDIYNSKYQTISKNRKRLVKILARELFLDDVLKELKQM